MHNAYQWFDFNDVIQCHAGACLSLHLSGLYNLGLTQPLTQIKRNQLRNGMIMVSLSQMSCWEFEGDILVLHHPTTISTIYQAMGE